MLLLCYIEFHQCSNQLCHNLDSVLFQIVSDFFRLEYWKTMSHTHSFRRPVCCVLLWLWFFQVKMIVTVSRNKKRLANTVIAGTASCWVKRGVELPSSTNSPDCSNTQLSNNPFLSDGPDLLKSRISAIFLNADELWNCLGTILIGFWVSNWMEFVRRGL